MTLQFPFQVVLRAVFALLVSLMLAPSGCGSIERGANSQGVGHPPVKQNAAGSIVTEGMVCLISQQDNGDRSVHLLVENKAAYPVTAMITLTELENMRSNVPLPHTQTIPGGQMVRVLTLNRTQGEGRRTYRWAARLAWTIGSMEARHNDKVAYSLPYASGSKFTVLQGFHGRHSHFGFNEYSVDFGMPVGTPVHAARTGVVVHVQSHFTDADGKPNIILIQHDDGTLGEYAHLQTGGARVKVGQQVKGGEWIGLSGNTGSSSSPHLHFMVFTAVDSKKQRSLPIVFRTADANSVVLMQGEIYTAP